MKTASKLYEVLNVIDHFLPKSKKIDDSIFITGSREEIMLEISKNEIKIIDTKLEENLKNRKSKLSDAFVEKQDINKFIKNLKDKSNVFLLNHIGFGYQVKSKPKERNRLSDLARSNKLQLYEIPSNDLGLWLFMGNKSGIPETMLEFLPVEHGNGFFTDYWLPHIHVDLDTMIPKEELKYTIHDSFQGRRSANISIADEKKVYQIRIWLGVINGVNICMDMTTDEFGSIRKRRKYQTNTKV